jgi:hypothetical protein
MSYRVTLTSEDHGYEIRLEKNISTLDKDNKFVERFETEAVLAIENKYQVALGTWEVLNNFINAMVKSEILKKNIFRIKPNVS